MYTQKDVEDALQSVEDLDASGFDFKDSRIIKTMRVLAFEVKRMRAEFDGLEAIMEGNNGR